MTFTFLRLEWRHIRRDLAFWLTTAVIAAAVVYGLANGFAWGRFQSAAIAKAETIASEKLAAARVDAARFDVTPSASLNPNLDPRDARGFEFFYLRRFAILPPAPAAALAVGQSDLLPYVLRVTYRPRETFLNPYEIENPLRLLLGRFDATFVALYLLPLGVLVIAHGLLSREREAGTLALLSSLPISLPHWLFARFALRGGLFLGAFVTATLAGWLSLGGDSRAFGDVSAWLGLTLAYGVFWFALAWYVGNRALTPSASVLTLAGAWLCLVVVLPASLNLALKHAYPLPSRAAFQDALRDGTDEAQRRGSQLLAKYLEDHPELAPGPAPANENDFFRARFAVNAEVERIAGPLRAAFSDQLARQQSAIERLRWLSPALVLHHAALDLAGTDRARHQRWLAAIGDLHRRMVDFFEPRLLRSAGFRDFDGVPNLQFVESRPAPADWFAALAGLLLPAFGLAIAGCQVLRRTKSPGSPS